MKRQIRLTLIAGGLAGFVAAIPSTAYFLMTGVDILEPLNTLAAMVSADRFPLPLRVIAAGAVHFTVSFFWAGVLVVSIPKRFSVPGALMAGTIIALLDLKIIAPYFFPGVASLKFAPQLVDHLVWGFVVGVVLRVSRSSISS